ncbi:MAG TPA: DUF1015 domain-containing protein [Vicinamibacteria bacterium]|jgi:uncharacterized protein (DUF1015 family)
MKLLAFQGYRYAAKAGEPDQLVAPPFDQIDPVLRDRLHARSPNQFSHLTRPVAEGDGDAHHHARALHEDWLARGIVVRDAEPSLYPYVIELAEGGLRRGLCGLVGVGPSSAGDLRPHEETVDKPLDERLALLETLRIDLEPVMYLAEDAGELENLIAEGTRSASALVRARDATGNVHSLYRIEEANRIERYQTLLGDRFAAIADGHHRTKAAQLFARKHAAPEGTAACAKMAVLISLASEHLRIDPIHRGVSVPLDRTGVAELAAGRIAWQGKGGGDLAKAVAESPQPSLGVWFQGSTPEIWKLDPKQISATAPRGGSTLPVVLLHDPLLRVAGLERRSATDGTIRYVDDPERLFEMIETGECQAGFWLPPMSAADFAAATASGEVLPPKSTRFLPKLISGLVWAGHDAAVR